MPTYRYRCSSCGEEFEVWQSFQDEPLHVHEICGGELRKVLTPAGIVLKGSGFYKTDNRSEHRSGSGPSGGKQDSSKQDSAKQDSSTSDSSGKDSKSESRSSGSESSGSGKSEPRKSESNADSGTSSSKGSGSGSST